MIKSISGSLAATLAVLALSLVAVPNAQADEPIECEDSTETAAPMVGAGAEFTLIQFVANGISTDPASFSFINVVGSLASCDGSSCMLGQYPSSCLADPNTFGRTLAEQQQMLDNLVALGSNTFGVNVANPWEYFILPYEARSDVGIRAMVMSGDVVPAAGYPVVDCGFQAVPIAPGKPAVVLGSYFIDGPDVTFDYELERELIQGQGMTLGRYNMASETYGDCTSQFVTASTCNGTVDPVFFTCNGTTSHDIENTIRCEPNMCGE